MKLKFNMLVLMIDDDLHGYEEKNLCSLCPKKNILTFKLLKKEPGFLTEENKKTVSPKITQKIRLVLT